MFGPMQWFEHPLLKKLQTAIDRLQLPDATRQQMPGFWKRSSALSIIARELLMPLSVIYYSIFLYKKSKIRPEKLSVPVWCVGNITVGGSGKTPFAVLLAEEMLKRGRRPAFLSRGFGGMVRTEVVKIDITRHTALEVGDEPLLLARTAPCYIATARVDAGRQAIADGADILILDDGLQHHALYKDCSFLMVEGSFGFGNAGILPAGPLREPPFKAYQAVQATVMVGEDKAKPFQKFPLPGNMPVLNVKLEAMPEWLEKNVGLRHEKLFAFAGIALPDKFFDSLQLLGFELVGKASYPDHYQFMPFELEDLRRQAQILGGRLITTEKDAVRLPPEFRDEVIVFPVHMTVRDPEAFARFLDSALAK